MAAIGYLIRVELKKQLGDPPEEARTCFVLPAPDCKLSQVEAGEKALDIVIEAVRDATRYPVIEETSRRRVFVDDLRPMRNSLLLEKEGWRCLRVKV